MNNSYNSKSLLVLRSIIFLMVLSIGIFFTYFMFHYAKIWNENNIRTEFETSASERISEIQWEIKDNINALKMIAVFINTSIKIGKNQFFDIHQEFHNFVSNLLSNHPDIEKIIWIPQVTNSNRHFFDNLTYSYPDSKFKILDKDNSDKLIQAYERNEYFPIYFEEPYKNSDIGLDMLKDLNFSKIIESGKKTLQPIISKRLEISNANSKFYVIICLVPIINKTKINKDELVGFVAGIFNLDKTIKESISELKPRGVNFMLNDNSAQEVIYTHVSRISDKKEPYTNESNNIKFKVNFEIGGREWSITAWPNLIFFTGKKFMPFVAAGAGIFFTIFSCFLLIMSMLRTSRIERKVIERTKELIKEIEDRKKAEFEAEKAKTNLIQRIYEIQQHNAELNLLSDMSNMLSSCISEKEAHNIISNYLPRFMPDYSGAIYLKNETSDFFEAVVSWGKKSFELNETIFVINECWGLRSGRMYEICDKNSGILCGHLIKSQPDLYLCIPLIAQGSAMGVLHIQTSEDKDAFLSAKKIAVALAENLSLALSNINLRETLRIQSIRDPLTGLYNRRYMDETLNREEKKAKRYKTSIGIIMIDIDFFKKYNDTFGHDAGDTVLKEMGNFVKNNIRGEDIPCRFGGEEFALVLPGADLKITIQRATQLCENVRTLKLLHEGKKLGNITLSLGVSIYPKHGDTWQDIVKNADEALYKAKQNGRNRVEIAELPEN